MSVKTKAQATYATTKPAQAPRPSTGRTSAGRGARNPGKRKYGDFHPACVALLAVLTIGGMVAISRANDSNVAVEQQHRLELRKKEARLEIEADKRRVANVAERLARFPPSGG